MRPFGKNYLGKFYSPEKVPYLVRLNDERREPYYTNYETMLSMKVWCSKNSTAGWVEKFYGWPNREIQFFFKKEDDAIHFKLRWF